MVSQESFSVQVLRTYKGSTKELVEPFEFA